jgi:hypothetical protein
MSITQEFLDTLRKLTAIEVRTQDIREDLSRVESKIDGLLDRLSRLEERGQVIYFLPY